MTIEQKADAFWTACREWQEASRAWQEASHAARLDPECPNWPLDGKEKLAAYDKFMKAAGVNALHDKSDDAHGKMGKALRDVFEAQAWTVQHLAFKFAVLHQCWAGGDEEQVYTCFERGRDHFFRSVDRDMAELADIEAKSSEWRTLTEDFPALARDTADAGLRAGDQVRLSPFTGWLDDGLYAVLAEISTGQQKLVRVGMAKVRTKDGSLRQRIELCDIIYGGGDEQFTIAIPRRIVATNRPERDSEGEGGLS